MYEFSYVHFQILFELFRDKENLSENAKFDSEAHTEGLNEANMGSKSYESLSVLRCLNAFLNLIVKHRTDMVLAR